MYRIAWISNKTQSCGHGTGLYSLEIAQKIANDLNKKDRDIGLFHYLEQIIDDEQEVNDNSK